MPQQLEELLGSQDPVARLLRELAAEGDGTKQGSAVLLSYVAAAAAAPAEESLLSLLEELEAAHCGTGAFAVCPMECLAAAAPAGASALRLGEFRRKLESRVCRGVGLCRGGGGPPAHLLAPLLGDETDCKAGSSCSTHCQYHRRVVRNAALSEMARRMCAGQEGWGEKLISPPYAELGKRTLAQLLGYCGCMAHRPATAGAGSAQKSNEAAAVPSLCQGFRRLPKSAVLLLGTYMRGGAQAVIDVGELGSELLHGFVRGVAAEARKHQLGHSHLRDELFQFANAVSHVLTSPAGMLAVVRCAGDTTNAAEHRAAVVADVLEREGMALPAATLWLLLAASSSASDAGSIQWLEAVAAIAPRADSDGHCDLGWGLMSQVMQYWAGTSLDAIDFEICHRSKRQRSDNGAAGQSQSSSFVKKCFCSALRCAAWMTSLGVRRSLGLGGAATLMVGDSGINMCSSLLAAFDGISKRAILGADTSKADTAACALEILLLLHTATSEKNAFVGTVLDHHCAAVSNDIVGPQLPFDVWAQLALFITTQFADHSRQIQTAVTLKIRWNVYACLAKRLVREGPDAVAQFNSDLPTSMAMAASRLVQRTQEIDVSAGLHDHDDMLIKISSAAEQLLTLCVAATRRNADAVLMAALASLAEICTLQDLVARAFMSQSAEGLEQSLARRTLITSVAILRHDIQPNATFKVARCTTALKVLRAFLTAAETASTMAQTIQRLLAQTFDTESSDDTVSVLVRSAFLEREQLHLGFTTEALRCLCQVASVHSALAGGIMAQDNQLLPRAIKWTARAVRAESTHETLEAIDALCCLLVLLCQRAEDQFWHQAQRHSRHFAEMVATVLQAAVKQDGGVAADSFVRPDAAAVGAVLRFVGEVSDCCFLSRELERAKIPDALDGLVSDSPRTEYLGLTEHQAGRLCQMSRAIRNAI